MLKMKIMFYVLMFLESAIALVPLQKMRLTLHSIAET